MLCVIYFVEYFMWKVNETSGIVYLVRTQSFPKNKHLIPLIRARRLKNVSFSENFAYVWNEWSLMYPWKVLSQFPSILRFLEPKFKQQNAEQPIITSCKQMHQLHEVGAALKLVSRDDRSFSLRIQSGFRIIDELLFPLNLSKKLLVFWWFQGK